MKFKMNLKSVKYYVVTMLLTLTIMANLLNATTVVYYVYDVSENVTYKITEVDGEVISTIVHIHDDGEI